MRRLVGVKNGSGVDSSTADPRAGFDPHSLRPDIGRRPTFGAASWNSGSEKSSSPILADSRTHRDWAVPTKNSIEHKTRTGVLVPFPPIAFPCVLVLPPCIFRVLPGIPSAMHS